MALSDYYNYYSETFLKDKLHSTGDQSTLLSPISAFTTYFVLRKETTSLFRGHVFIAQRWSSYTYISVAQSNLAQLYMLSV